MNDWEDLGRGEVGKGEVMGRRKCKDVAFTNYRLGA